MKYYIFYLELFEPHTPHKETIASCENSQKVCQNNRLVIPILMMYHPFLDFFFPQKG